MLRQRGVETEERGDRAEWRQRGVETEGSGSRLNGNTGEWRCYHCDLCDYVLLTHHINNAR